MYKRVLIVLLVMLSFLFQALFAAPQMQQIKQDKWQKTGFFNMIPNLTDAQKQKIKSLLEEEQNKIKAIREEYRQKMEKVLTPQQLKSLRDGIAKKMTDEQVAHLTKALNLSTDQQNKVKLIYQKYQNQLKSNKNKQNKKEFMNTINKINEEIKAVLTDDQKAKFEKMKKIPTPDNMEHRNQGTNKVK